mgnify:CR=1 FL=1
MPFEIIAIGQNMPEWVKIACTNYQKRLPQNTKLTITEVPIIKRPKSASISNINKIKQQESQALLSHAKKNSYLIALDSTGKQFDTIEMAAKIDRINQTHSHIVFLIGGPDGLSDELKLKSHEIWSFSKLTFAHPIVRVILSEQIYRSWSYNQGHPYHK